MVLYPPPTKLPSINGQINGKCIFTDQNSLSVVEGSLDRSTPFGKTNITVVNYSIQSNQSNEGSLVDFAGELKPPGTVFQRTNSIPIFARED